MARVTFGPALQRHVKSPPLDVTGATLREALDAAFAINAHIRGYILDDQAHLRKHMNIFVDGRMISDRKNFSEPVTPTSQIFVVQALSGG
jgi:sulfur-carrier protein